ncbi:hypothetical protein DdX_08253 [Ditylenchus destructor]|uniref:Uncharacterized protein n=1 Tax=Ditylenchus destructor TaxID=166010 RepID=A0AAD4N857_9BILA|nr:hypothetical protein DdX_08253 [Ditylenchus destructor]
MGIVRLFFPFYPQGALEGLALGEKELVNDMKDEHAPPAEKKYRPNTDLRYKRSAEESEQTPEPNEPDTKFRWGEVYSSELKKMI